MDIKYKKSQNNLKVFFSGEIDEYSAVNAREALDKLLVDNLMCDKFIFDLADVTFMDSTGVGLLIGRYKKIKPFNMPIYISNASIVADKVLTLAGLYSIMPKC